jgi:hypothetical protein
LSILKGKSRNVRKEKKALMLLMNDNKKINKKIKFYIRSLRKKRWIRTLRSSTCIIDNAFEALQTPI